MRTQQTLFDIEEPGLSPAELTELQRDWDELDELLARAEQEHETT